MASCSLYFYATQHASVAKLTSPSKFGCFFRKIYRYPFTSEVTLRVRSTWFKGVLVFRSLLLAFPLNLPPQPLSVNVAVPYNTTGINHVARSKYFQVFRYLFRSRATNTYDFVYWMRCNISVFQIARKYMHGC